MNQGTRDFAEAMASRRPMDYDLMNGMAEVASNDYQELGKALGLNFSDSQSAREFLKVHYMDSVFGAMVDAAHEIDARERSERSAATARTMYGYSGIDENERQRINLAAVAGDFTGIHRVVNKFYFG